MIYQVNIAGKRYSIALTRSGATWVCKVNDRLLTADVVTARKGVLSLLIDGKSYEISQEPASSAPGDTFVFVGGERFAATIRDPRSLRSRGARDGASGAKKLLAPMPGKIIRILTATGSAVEAGQGILIIEAMKMQNELKSPKTGKLTKLSIAAGALVEAGQVLAEIE